VWVKDPRAVLRRISKTPTFPFFIGLVGHGEFGISDALSGDPGIVSRTSRSSPEDVFPFSATPTGQDTRGSGTERTGFSRRGQVFRLNALGPGPVILFTGAWLLSYFSGKKAAIASSDQPS
jgi:hypothetical protein